MKLGYIDYLNCYPLYYHMFEKKPLEDVEITSAIPGELNRMMRESLLDMSAVSAAACADMAEDIQVLPDVCLSSVGYVGSVMLYSKEPIEALDGKVIGLSKASATTVGLLKILLKKYYGLDPNYTRIGTRPVLKDIDAALLIGNDAMVTPPEPVPYTYDLGDLWHRKTGYPVVFGVFVIARKALEQYPAQIDAVIRSYRQSLAAFHSEKENLVAKAREKYPDIVYDLNQYYDRFEFHFTDKLKEALDFYLNTAAELGFLKKVEKLVYYPSDPLC